jgi:hypothetical protein
VTAVVFIEISDFRDNSVVSPTARTPMVSFNEILQVHWCNG